MLAAAQQIEVTTQGGSWIPWVAVGAVAAAIIAALASRAADRRDRRRTLYSDAYRAGLAWVEALYRVRRRDPNKPYELAGQFHQLQEQIDFHQGWISSESSELGRAYERFISAIKQLTVEEIRSAWRNDPCRPEDGFTLQDEHHPDVKPVKDQFIEDARDHLAIGRFWRRRGLKQRYSDEAWQRMNAARSPARGGTS
jgi:hypothetical protein